MGTSSWEPSQRSSKRQLCNSQNTVEMAWVVHTIHTILTVSVLTLLYSPVTMCHLHWPCLRNKNSEYGLDGTYTTVERTITAGRRAFMFLRGMGELVFCIVLSVGV